MYTIYALARDTYHKKSRNLAVATKKRTKAVKTDGRYRNDKPTVIILKRGNIHQIAEHNITCNKSTRNEAPRRGKSIGYILRSI